MILRLLGFLVLLAGLGCAGGGGGGGTAPVLVFLTGRVLWIETGAPPSPQGTVRSGTVATLTDDFDGFFELQVPAGTTSLTITYAPPGSAVVVRTFTFSALTDDRDLGDLYIGPSEVTIRGTAVDASNGDPVPGAAVTIAGRSGTSDATGVFSVPGVAYSSTSLVVFLGLEGLVSKAGYITQPFSPPSGPSGGIVQVGQIQLTPAGTTEPPPFPYNVTGSVLPLNIGPGATVELLSGGVPIRTGVAGGASKFYFWAPAGPYTVRASKSGMIGTANVTVTDVNVIKSVNVTLQ